MVSVLYIGSWDKYGLKCEGRCIHCYDEISVNESKITIITGMVMECIHAYQTCQFRATRSDSDLWIYHFLNLHGISLFDGSVSNSILFRLINAVLCAFEAYSKVKVKVKLSM
jgi:hypothetical protein